METDLRNEGLNVHIVAVGGMQFQSTTSEIQGMAAGGTLPIVEETAQQPVWQNWGAQWRDLYILDTNGNLFTKLNLTAFDPDPVVNNGQNYTQLKSLFVEAATAGISSTQFSVSTLAVGQDAGNAVLELTRMGGMAGPASVTVVTTDGSAVASTDYTPIHTVVTFPAGVTSETVSIPIVHSGIVKPPVSFTVPLVHPTDSMQLGTPAQAVVTIYSDSPTPTQRYVTAAYQALLQRPPESGGLAYWGGLLDRGELRSDLAALLTHSAEYYQTNVIEPAYEQFFHRAADQSGLDYWTARLQGGMTDEQLQAEFIASPEFYASADHSNPPIPRSPAADRLWVDALYQSLLGRGPDQVGEDYWTGQLHGPETLLQVANAFTGSNEGLALRIQQNYQRYLGRATDGDGLAYWLGRYRQGGVNEDFVNGLIGSDEFFRRATN